MKKNERVHWFCRHSEPDTMLAVHGVGINEKMAKGEIVDRGQGTGDNLLMYFHSPVLLKTRGVVRLEPAGTLVLWGEGMGHYYGSADSSYVHSWLHCGGWRAGELWRGLGVGLDLPLRVGAGVVLDNLRAILAERLRGDYESAILSNLVENFLLGVRRAVLPDGGMRAPDNLLEVKHYIERNYASSLSLEELASLAGMSSSHFIARYRECFGVPPRRYQTKLRMEAALYLLRDRNLTISEIACRTGYADVYHFSKQFKKYFRSCPSEMRLINHE